MFRMILAILFIPMICFAQGNRKVEVYDFYANWCPPCRQFAPTFNKWTKEYPSVKFHKVNVDKQAEFARKHQIKALPTVIIFRDGKEVKRFVGAPEKSQVVKFLK